MRFWKAVEVSLLMVAGQCLLLVGCRTTGTELELTAYDLAQDQQKIAGFLGQEAERFRQKARELTHRAAVYEHLFGKDSDWVTGTQLLVESYEAAAQDRERTAETHRQAAQGHGFFFP